MKDLFTWAHLSDLHFQDGQDESSGFNSTTLKKSLPEYLSAYKGVDALIISGDFRFAPSKEDNPQGVADFITKIAEALEVALDKIYLVPGNHDIDRDTIRDDVIFQLRQCYKTLNGSFEKSRFNLLTSGFTFYEELIKLLPESSGIIPIDSPHRMMQLPCCNLLLLNTSLTAGMSDSSGIVDDEHHLLIGSKYLSNALESADILKPTIAIGHHGIEFLQDDEAKACSTALENAGVLLYLCGHSHQMWSSAFTDKGKQFTVGCLKQDTMQVDAGFAIGKLSGDGSVKINSHAWSPSHQKWTPSTINDKKYEHLYPSLTTATLPDKAAAHISSASKEKAPVMQTQHSFSLASYVLLGGRGIDGIKYIWKKDNKIVESLAFNRRLKDSDQPDVTSVSAYTSSVSYGCQLSASNQACLFCETGSLRYEGDVTAEDIALQNIFMAEYDSDCPSYKHVRTNSREFAFMGQGEPGLCYPAVRRAIQLTDYAMISIKQSVHRYIISTCGIGDFIPLLIQDIQNHTFQNKVTLHFSLHAFGDDRNILMPINRDHNYEHFIKQCIRFHEATGDKIGVGILLFNQYSAIKGQNPITLTTTQLKKILDVLERDVFRIDLCDVNHTFNMSQASFRNEDAIALLDFAKDAGFEAKTFSSFGDNQSSGCGMLSSSQAASTPIGNNTITHFNASVDLLKRAIEAIDS